MVTQVFLGGAVFKRDFGDDEYANTVVVGVDMVIVVVAFGVVIDEGFTVVEVTASRIKILNSDYFLLHFD